MHVTDDSSTALDIGAHAWMDDPRVAYSWNAERLGPAQNWNSALARARGTYVKFLHHDDWLTTTDSLATFVETALRSGAGFVFAASDAVDTTGRVVSVNRPTAATVRHFADEPRSLLRSGNFVGGPSATLFRREDRIRFDPRLKWLVDIEFYLSYLERHPGVAYVDERLVSTTTDASHQVTASSLGNLSVELFEWDLVYRRHWPGAPLRRLAKMRQLSRRYGVTSESGPSQADLSLGSRLAARWGAAEGVLMKGLRPRSGQEAG